MRTRTRNAWAATTLVTCLVFGMGCTTTSPGGDSATSAASELERLLLLMADRKIYEPFTVTQALGEGSATRIQLADALGRTGASEALGPLTALLADESLAVQRRAAFALGLLGDARAAGALRVVVGGTDRALGRIAVEALAKLDEPLASVDDALEGLPDEERWARLAPSLFRFDPETVLEYGVRGFGVTDPATRRWLVYGLARDPIAEGLPILRSFLADPDPQIRAWAARALGLVGGVAEVPLLLAQAAEEDAVAIEAVTGVRRLLERLPEVDRLEAAAAREWLAPWLALTKRPHPGVRAAAITAAAAWPASDELDARLLDLATNGSVRELELGLTALGARAPGEDRGPNARPFGRLLGKAIEHRAASVRAVAARVASEIGRGEWVEALAFDDSPGVRMAVHEFLLAGAPDEAAAGAVWILKDPDAVVRAATLEWLTEQPRLPIDALAVAMEGYTADSAGELPVAFTRAVAARAAAEPLERGQGVEYLEALQGSARYVVRRAAAEALDELGVPSARPEPAATEAPENFYGAVLEKTRGPRAVELETVAGTVRIELECSSAPLTCSSFLQLVGQGFYDGLRFHRVVPGFVVQAGDPRGDGWGGPGYELRAEVNPLRYERGVLGMADSGWDTAGSQFFLTLAPQPHLDGRYTAFGRVVSGDAVLDAIQQGDPIAAIREVQP